MLMRASLASATVCVLFLSSCHRQASPPPEAAHATVVLRDGSQASGTVAATTPAQITLNLDNNAGSRTIPMSQVSSINYDQAPAAQPAAASPPPAAAPPSQPPAAAPAATEQPPQPAIQSKTLVVPAGAELRVRCEETIDSRRAVEGQTYAAEVASNVRDADGAVVIPRGANAHLVIRSVSRGGRFRGASDLVLDLQSVAVEGQEYTVDTANVAVRGRSGLGANKRTGEFVGGGAALGAIVGAIAGHGKGAAIGAASGAGAGALTQVLTKGSIRVPAETILTFRLERPLRIVQAQ
jgi:hypothetical protein